MQCTCVELMQRIVTVKGLVPECVLLRFTSRLSIENCTSSPAYARVNLRPSPVQRTATTRPGMTVGMKGDPEIGRPCTETRIVY